MPARGREGERFGRKNRRALLTAPAHAVSPVPPRRGTCGFHKADVQRAVSILNWSAMTPAVGGKVVLVVLLSVGLAWAIWGLPTAGVVAVVGVLVHLLIGYNTKRLAARNAVYAALTYRTLTAEQQGAVDGTVVRICQRLRIDASTLGPPFPGGEQADGPTLSSPAAVFAFRSLAMHELGIPPVGASVPKWYVIRNPFFATLARDQVRAFRRQVEAEYRVSLDELDG